MSAVELVGLRKTFGHVTAVDSVDLRVEDGESLVVLGPSGSGKSTLLRLVAGLETANDGDVSIGGVSQAVLPAHRRDVAIVFQHFALYPHLSALTNITLGLRHGLKLSAREAELRARDVAERLEITELLSRLPRAMSGGQRQRVALGRALARQAGVVLLDEPLSGLDAQLRLTLRVEIASVLRSTGATTVHVTHDQMDAMAMADRIAVMRDGRIEQIGSPDDLYQRPRTSFVAGFIGSPSMNLLYLERIGSAYPSPFGPIPPTEHETVTVGVRPEHVRLGRPPAHGSGQLHTSALVTLVERTGPDQLVYVALESGVFALRCGSEVSVAAGEQVEVWVRTTDVHVFGGPGEAYVGSVAELSPSAQPSDVAVKAS